MGSTSRWAVLARDREGDSLKRLHLVFILGIFLSIVNAWVGAAADPRMIGVLFVGDNPDDAALEAFRRGLTDFGYVEGDNIRVEYRLARGKIDHLPQLAEELVRLNPEVIVAVSEASLRAAKQATDTIPIVMVAYGHDPIATGLIESLGQPGGNITGIDSGLTDLTAKRLQLLKETVPTAKRIAVLWGESSKSELEHLPGAARTVGVQLEMIEVRPPHDFEAALRAARTKHCDAVLLLFSIASWAQREKIPPVAERTRLPVMYWNRSSVEAGGLISYSPVLSATFGRAAYFVDRLLKGASPRELPVEQPNKVHLAVNLKAAKALGMAIPESILLRADEVIR